MSTIHIFFLLLFSFTASAFKTSVEVRHLGVAADVANAHNNGSSKINATKGICTAVSGSGNWQFHPLASPSCVYNSKGEPVYENLGKLGEGGFGTVFQVKKIDDDSPIRAMNIFFAEEAKAVEKLKNDGREEANIQKLVKQKTHQVPAIFEEFELESGFGFIMDLVGGKSMEDLIPLASLGETRKAFQSLVKVVDACHEIKVAHRDLKLENFFWNGSEVTLLDFGFAVNFADNSDSGEVKRVKNHSHYVKGNEPLVLSGGTREYAALEVLLNEDEFTKKGGFDWNELHTYAGPPADVWSLGVVLYLMLTGDLPFPGNKGKILRDFSWSRKDSFKTLEHINPAKDLVVDMLALRPQDRPTTQTILKHAFFTTPAIANLSSEDVDCLGYNKKTSGGLFGIGKTTKKYCCCTFPAVCTCRAGQDNEVCSKTSGKLEARRFIFPSKGQCKKVVEIVA